MLHHYDTRTEPGERLSVRCRNRRASVCAPCSRLHAGDTFHLVRAGLAGGKNIPAQVREHPRLFVTLTAPSFGPVHRATTDGERCRPRRNAGTCEHERSVSCGAVHDSAEAVVGQPLCPGCYDYPAHVLWHAHAGELWDRFTRATRRTLASAVGLAQTRFADHARLSFAKVAEYQKRAAVHVHSVIRLDGPDGLHAPPPAWATPELLTRAVRTAARSVLVRSPYSPAVGELLFRWGTQLDARPLRAFGDTDARPLHAFGDTDGLADDAVAAYVAKYVTKDASDTAAGTDYPLLNWDDIDAAPVSPHVRALIRTCWHLGSLPEYEPLRLRPWAHTLGYRGHILTKSRLYSTPYFALRAHRAQYQQRTATGAPDDPEVVTDSRWRYVGSGHSSGAALIAVGIAEDLATNRQVAREEQARPDA